MKKSGSGEIVADYAPPPKGAGWACPAEDRLDLVYLAWGERRYGETPLREEARGDWLYCCPKSGCPFYVREGRRSALPAGTMLIVAPGCPVGFQDERGRRCEIRTWVWRSAPLFPVLHPPEGGCLRVELGAEQRREVSTLALLSRREVQTPDPLSKEALRILHERLDLCLAREMSGGANSPALAGQRLELALRWLREHPGELSPSGRLCEYLQVSPATLHRLFVRHLGHGPREEALRLRQAEAERLIEEEGWSVKAAAFHLGYRHANDLSRAMARPRTPARGAAALKAR